MTRTVCILALVLIVALTGFTTPVLSAPTETEATTATAAGQSSAVASCQAENATSSLPPGTTTDGIENATRLFETHRSQLNNETYTEHAEWEEVSEETSQNGTASGLTSSQYTVVVEKGTTATHTTLEGDNVSLVTWITDESVAVKNDEEGALSSTMYAYVRDETVSQTARQSWTSFTEIPQGQLFEYLDGLEYEYAGVVTRENQTLHRFTATGFDASEKADSQSEFQPTLDQINATVLVSEQGVVRTLTTTETHIGGNETIRTEQNYSVRTPQPITPTRPGWVCNELPRLNASITGNGTVIALEHTGGIPVSSGMVMLTSPSGSEAALLNESFEPGETLYLYQTQNATSRLGVSQNEMPRVNESFVALGGDRLSLSVDRSIYDTYDTGATIQLDVENNTATGDPSFDAVPNSSSKP